MKATLERDHLLKALTNVSSVADKQAVASILGNVLIQFGKDGKVRLCATDSEVEMQESVTAVSVDKDGATTVPAQILHQIIDRLPAGAQITMESDSKQLVLKSGKANFSLQVLPGEDFPFLSQDNKTTQNIAVGAKDLHRLLEKTRAAISDSGPRYYLQGVYLHKSPEGALRAVATDGHRLAYVDLAAKLPDDMPAVIVPRKAVLGVLRLIDKDSDTEVAVGLAENKIIFSLNDGAQKLTSKLIDGQFPDYHRVIPQDNDKKINLDIGQFMEKVRAVSAVSKEKARAVRFKVSKALMRLEVQDSDTGQASDELSVTYDGADVEIGFNAAYLQDIADQMTGQPATIELKDANSPAILRDDADAQALYILMPMRV